MTKDPSRYFRLLCLPLFIVLADAAPAPSWPQAAMQDLQAMHDIVRDNHPGPVDPKNPKFRDWLDGGEAALMPQARAARSLHDYQVVLRDYANGFGDGHLNIAMTDPEAHLWPGFLVRADAPGAPLIVSVVAPEAPPGVQPGQTLKSCGGIPAQNLLLDRVLRPALNPHVPQRLRLASALLMVADADDPAGQWQSCVLSSAGQDKAVPLHWRPIADDALAQERMRSSGIDVPETGLRRIGDVWLISLPSFAPRDTAATTRLQTLLEAVKANATTLHDARHVVLDLRGNDGGEDTWGFEVAEALWGKAAVEAVQASQPESVDWRVSARNEAAMQDYAALMRRQNLNDDAAYYDNLAQRMELARSQHELFMHEASDPPGVAPHLTSPFAHPVYLLTTPHCASACLDFVDVLNGLPGLIRVGLETSSDTDYLSVAAAMLPSGHATLRYAMKVFRQRPRAANASYKPAIGWPGQYMDDTSIVRWIDRLP